MPNKTAPIGIFDSGVGGLTVFREIMHKLPDERIVYFGDTARVPYGNKSPETVARYAGQIVRFLESKRVKAIVVACNTASALAMEEIEARSAVPTLEVIKPGARSAARTTSNGRIGVIATEATIGSNIYANYIKTLGENLIVTGKACPLFVPLVEEGLLNDRVTDEVAKRYLTELIETDIDTLILGCTHYPLIRETIKRVMGEKVKLVNPAHETASELEKLLKANCLLNDEETSESESKYHFYVSDGAEKFKQFAASIIKYGILATKTINIEAY
ncbi:MAG: glutamate racemase [Lachnospiraceae bacterium]|nr:glutamate racemase [Lachnospiraceae bacterium]